MKNEPAFFEFFKGFLVGVLGLGIFYYLLLFAVTQDAAHPLVQFSLFQPWMSLLIIGFGIQMGLFWLLRQGYQISLSDKNDAKFAAGTGTAASGIAMAACCAHHLVDIMPILGLSAAAVFLTDYQQEFIIIGVIANAAGIILMAWLITNKPTATEVISYISSRRRRII